MSPAESAARAAKWLEDLIAELPGLRNATSRDPGFKNWRQNALTTMQRIWPADQDHAERFRRIPFSPVDPRADTRTQRESFSRGCQEAARVLGSFVEEVRTKGVPEILADTQVTEESGFEDGFPTVDLPSGDLGGAGARDSDAAGMPAQGADPSFTPPAFDSHSGVHAQPAHPAASVHPASPLPEARPARKGLGVAAKLRDLLGLTGFTGKAAPAPPPPVAPETMSDTTSMPAPLPRALDIIPVGDDVDSRRRSGWWPRPEPSTQAPGTPASPAPHASPTPPAPPAQASTPDPASPGAPHTAPPPDAGMSVVMSRPTTLRGSINKVSIESLISPEFRAGTESGTPASATPPASAAPPASVTPPAAAASSAASAPATPRAPAAPASSDPSKIVPLPLPPVARTTEPVPPPADAADAEQPDATGSPGPDSGELARATQDFMRSSPVLGANARKPQRPGHEPDSHGLTDPDAIAILSMVDELTLMGVPTTRQSETRARLLDLARRIEAADIKWNSLRAAVWFAMEYPEVARRLLPILLPWIDRAA